MKRDGSCKRCNTVFTKQRNPSQAYCSAPDCQRERKNKWRRDKMSADSDYKNNQQVANKRWQIKHPVYWRDYRASHPDYVQSNRNAQRARDRTADNNILPHSMDSGVGGGNASHLAKSDALPTETLINTGSYWLIAIDDNLAKSDALLVKITLITEGYHKAHDLAKSLLYSQGG